MSSKLDELIGSGFTIKDILETAKHLRKNEVIRCDECNRRLGDIDGILIIKCRCGTFKNYTI